MTCKPLQPVFKPTAAALFAPLLVFLALCCGTPPASAKECVVVDTDAHLDDYRAIATIARSKTIVAIVVTEGIARTAPGKAAMEWFLGRSRLNIPVLQGASPDPKRDYRPPQDLLKWRATAESLNGIFPGSPATTDTGFNVAATLRPHLAECTELTLLVIGPWTSFMQYVSEVLPKTERIIAQGRPYPDELGGVPEGFNCKYDENSCHAAFDVLVGRQLRAGRRLRTTWVDIPGTLDACGKAEPGIDGNTGQRQFFFSPTEAWANELRQAGGMASLIGEMLEKDLTAWQKTSLWDDLAALYIVRPQMFGVRGGHLEPCISAESVRKQLTHLMSLQ